jgi:hypothetical protein
MSKPQPIDPDAVKVARIRDFNNSGIKSFVSDGHTKCKRCSNLIPTGIAFTWVRGKGSYHIGSCPKPEREN